MKGLIYKDYCIFRQRNNLWSTFISIATFAVIICIFQNFYGLALTVLLSLPLGGGSFMQMIAIEEEKTNLSDRLVALPVSKAGLVRSRFYSSFLVLGFFEAIALLITLYYTGIVGVTSLSSGLFLWYGGVILGTIFLSVNAFSYHLLGVQKGNIAFLIMMVLSIIGYLVFYFWLGFETLFTIGILPLLLGATCIALALTGLSYVLCVKLFKRNYR